MWKYVVHIVSVIKSRHGIYVFHPLTVRTDTLHTPTGNETAVFGLFGRDQVIRFRNINGLDSLILTSIPGQIQ